ncbi:hypothetical protein [Parasphingorhabdus sp.]|uniref:hypothetical protein n=1 Tax=Parasphingorhabdus sp. TaxID=2709688 RepID=UPI003D2C68A6
MEVSWEQLKKEAQATSRQFTLELMELEYVEDGYSSFVNLIERALDFAAQDMSKNKNILIDQTEDQLTYAMLAMLRGMSFNASHSKNNGGNCDIVIESGLSMTWLGEAKKFTSSYGKLLGGYRQLADRYATGLPNQLSGGEIIYMYGADAKTMLDNWRDYLAQQNGINVEHDKDKPLEFRSTQKHQGSGLQISIRHTPIVLHHQPTDTQKAPPRKK